jgi:hypothetical protein
MSTVVDESDASPNGAAGGEAGQRSRTTILGLLAVSAMQRNSTRVNRVMMWRKFREKSPS